jgi:hypothetical protein
MLYELNRAATTLASQQGGHAGDIDGPDGGVKLAIGQWDHHWTGWVGYRLELPAIGIGVTRDHQLEAQRRLPQRKNNRPGKLGSKNARGVYSTPTPPMPDRDFLPKP